MVSNLAIKLPEAFVKFFIDISVNPGNVIKILRDFRTIVSRTLDLNLPMCKNVKEGYDAPAANLDELDEDDVPFDAGSNMDGHQGVSFDDDDVVVAQM